MKQAILACLVVIALVVVYMQAMPAAVEANQDEPVTTRAQPETHNLPKFIDKPARNFTWQATPGRDLFDWSPVLPQTQTQAPDITQAAPAGPDFNFTIQAVMLGQQKSIVIDYKRYAVGDNIGKYTIVDITRHHIILDLRGTAYRVDF